MRIRGLVILCIPALVASCKDEPPASHDTGASSAAVSAPTPVASVPAAASSVVIPSSSLALPEVDHLPPALSAPPVASAPAPVKSAAPAAPKPKSTASAAGTSLPAASASAAPTASAAATGSAPSVASASGSAAPPDAALSDPAADALAARVDEFYMGRKSLSVRFKQEFYIQSTGKKKTSSGTMRFLRPGKMSWRYDPPNTNVVVCDGTTVSVYEGESNQYTQQPFQNSEYAGALGFLSGEGIRKYFNFRFHTVSNFPGGKVLYGTPKARNAGYDFVLFYVDEATAHIRRVVIIDAQRNRNRFDLESLSEVPIEPREFAWTPPPGATLIAR